MGQGPPKTNVSSAHHTLMPLLVLVLALVLVLVLVLARMLEPAHAAAARQVWLGRPGRTSGAGCFRLANLQLAPVLRSCPPSGEHQHRGRGQ